VILTVEVVKLLSSSAMVKGQAEVAGRTVVKSTITLAAVRAEELRGGRRATMPEVATKGAP